MLKKQRRHILCGVATGPTKFAIDGSIFGEHVERLEFV